MSQLRGLAHGILVLAIVQIHLLGLYIVEWMGFVVKGGLGLGLRLDNMTKQTKRKLHMPDPSDLKKPRFPFLAWSLSNKMNIPSPRLGSGPALAG